MNWGLGKPGVALSFFQWDADCMLGPSNKSSGLDRWGNGHGDPAVSFTEYNDEQRCRDCTSWHCMPVSLFHYIVNLLFPPMPPRYSVVTSFKNRCQRSVAVLSII